MKIFLIFLILGLMCLAIFYFLHQKQEKVSAKPAAKTPVEELIFKEEKAEKRSEVTWENYKLPMELEIPEITHGDLIIKRKAYTLSFSEQHEQAKWVAYTLSLSELNAKAERKDHFRADPDIETESAQLSDYKGSGYDRGHLAPAADMSWSEKVMDESFFMSNMSPQEPSFNRGIWKQLEEQVREWVKTDTLLYIITGPVLTQNLESIGKNQVSVPQFYYKVVADFSLPEIKTIAFLMPNKKLDDGIYNYVVSIDSIESLTGIDMFWALPNELENAVENAVSWQSWSK